MPKPLMSLNSETIFRSNSSEARTAVANKARVENFMVYEFVDEKIEMMEKTSSFYNQIFSLFQISLFNFVVAS